MSVYTLQRPSQLPNTVFVLLVMNGLAFAFLKFNPNWVLYYFALWTPSPLDPPFRMWQLLTYGFLHSPNNLMHILFNMLALWMFGREVEHRMGSVRFAVFFLVCIVGAGLCQLAAAKIAGGFYPTVGASGGVFGLLLAFGVLFPNRTIMLLIPPIPMKAKYLVIVFGVMELYLGLSGGAPGVANFAHLGGMLVGLLLLIQWRIVRFPSSK